MKISDLELKPLRNPKRVGRGISAGQGKTAGRGTKGQNARTGGGVRPGFEGGQNPLAKRLPKKRGFASLSRIDYQEINLSQLNSLKEGASADNAALAKAGVTKQAHQPVKLLGTGKLDKKLTVKVQASTRTAKAAIEKAGGTLEIVPVPRRTNKTKASA